MPSLNTYSIMRWRVDWDGRTPIVNPLENTQRQVAMLLADGATSTDSQVLMEYVQSLQQDERDDAIQAIRDGLITVSLVFKAQVTAPAVPPRLRAAGPPNQQQSTAQYGQQ